MHQVRVPCPHMQIVSLTNIARIRLRRSSPPLHSCPFPIPAPLELELRSDYIRSECNTSHFEHRPKCGYLPHATHPATEFLLGIKQS